MTRIISWNVRGIGRKGFLSQTKEISRLYESDIIILMETKVNSARVINIIKKSNFNNFKEISPIGLHGGI